MCDKEIIIKNRIWIQKGDYTFIGEGRIKLLKEIDKMGSLSQASKSIGLSYQKAWTLINAMSKSAKEPVIQTHIGGKKGGGMTITKYGKNLIKKFDTLTEDVNRFLKEKEKEFKSML